MIRNFTNDHEDITAASGHRFACAFLDHMRARIVRVPGADRASLQSRSDAGRGRDLPLRQGGPQALRRHPARGDSGKAVLHEFVTASGGLHRRPVRRAGTPGGAAGQVHRRHGTASIHGRAVALAGACRDLGATRAVGFRLPYITITPTFSVCPVHGYLEGEQRILSEVRRRQLAAKWQVSAA